MDKLIKTITGGMPMKLDDFLWENGELDANNYGIYEAIQAQLLAYGTNFIVQGCVYSAPNISAGWIMLDSELLRVDAHVGTDVYFSKSTTTDARGDKTFNDASIQNTYQVNRGILDAGSGNLNITTAKTLKNLAKNPDAWVNLPFVGTSEYTNESPVLQYRYLNEGVIQIRGRILAGAQTTGLVTDLNGAGYDFIFPANELGFNIWDINADVFASIYLDPLSKVIVVPNGTTGRSYHINITYSID